MALGEELSHEFETLGNGEVSNWFFQDVSKEVSQDLFQEILLLRQAGMGNFGLSQHLQFLGRLQR